MIAPTLILTANDIQACSFLSIKEPTHLFLDIEAIAKYIRANNVNYAFSHNLRALAQGDVRFYLHMDPGTYRPTSICSLLGIGYEYFNRLYISVGGKRPIPLSQVHGNHYLGVLDLTIGN